MPLRNKPLEIASVEGYDDDDSVVYHFNSCIKLQCRPGEPARAYANRLHRSSLRPQIISVGRVFYPDMSVPVGIVSPDGAEAYINALRHRTEEGLRSLRCWILGDEYTFEQILEGACTLMTFEKEHDENGKPYLGTRHSRWHIKYGELFSDLFPSIFNIWELPIAVEHDINYVRSARDDLRDAVKVEALQSIFERTPIYRYESGKYRQA